MDVGLRFGGFGIQVQLPPCGRVAVILLLQVNRSRQHRADVLVNIPRPDSCFDPDFLVLGESGGDHVVGGVIIGGWGASIGIPADVIPGQRHPDRSRHAALFSHSNRKGGPDDGGGDIGSVGGGNRRGTRPGNPAPVDEGVGLGKDNVRGLGPGSAQGDPGFRAERGRKRGRHTGHLDRCVFRRGQADCAGGSHSVIRGKRAVFIRVQEIGLDLVANVVPGQ